MTYARKVDANQKGIVDALRAVGVSVLDLSRCGHGTPDLLCAKGQRAWLIECKGPKGTLTEDQAKFIEGWRGDVHIIRTVGEALALVGVLDRGPRAQ